VTPHQRLLWHLAEGTLDAEDGAHSARCPACAALLPASPATSDARGFSAFLEAAHEEAARPVRRWWVAGLALALGNLVLAAAAIRVLEPWNWGVSTSPHWLFLGAAFLLGALVTLGSVWALSPARRWLSGAVALAFAAPLVVLLAADGRVANLRFSDGINCLFTVVVLSLLPLAGGAWLLTQSVEAPARAFVVGLISAGVGLLVLQFHCADGASSHLLVFHLLPWAALGFASVLLRRLLPTRSYAP
jgi:Negative regulator of sigma F